MKLWTYHNPHDIAEIKVGRLPDLGHNYYKTRKEARETRKHYVPKKGWWRLVQMEVNFTIKDE